METRRYWIAGLALFVITMALYWPTTTFPFVNYDDQLYVYQSPNVIKGLSWNGIKWAFTANVAANWHPLTLLSHMADCSVYHLFAGGHHLTNILFHSVNTVLLFLLVRRMTDRFGPSLLVAALFAWHPLNVESVAWIAERKNVLSTFFFILTLLAYLRYGENPKLPTYLLTLVLFVLGLASKPMLVTLPFLLILLDYWPLKRLLPPLDSAKPRMESMQILVWEKIPFFILSVTDCVITCLFQERGGSVVSLTTLPIGLRLWNVPVAYLTYLEKTFWPEKLCVLYQFPQTLPLFAAVISIILLVALSCVAFCWRSKFRWLFVGWFWFLGTMVPVIGLVQAGAAPWSDRYMYVPAIGLFLIIACGLSELWARRASLRVLIVSATTLFICFCLIRSRQQINCWRNGVALFTQAVAVAPGNPYTQYLLGTAYNGEGQLNNAIEHFAAAASMRPQNVEYQYNLGLDLINVGKFEEAEDHLNAALKEKPDDPTLHNALGVALIQSQKPIEAEHEFSTAITLRPDYAKPYINLGKAYLKSGQASFAITNFVTALRLEPNSPETMQALAASYADAGELSNAVSTASAAVQIAQSKGLTGLAGQISTELNSYRAKMGQQSPH